MAKIAHAKEIHRIAEFMIALLFTVFAEETSEQDNLWPSVLCQER
jgi:hypothetical protein